MDKTDIDLVHETVAGNMQSYDTLMTRYQEFVYMIAFNFGKTKENALDISQEVFLKVYKKLNTFKENSTFKTWISKVAYNESVNWSKKNKKYLQQDEISNIKINPASNQNPEEELLIEENRALLLRCLFDLNTRYRLAVVLRYFENMPIKDIAASLKSLFLRSSTGRSNAVGTTADIASFPPNGLTISVT